MGNSQRKGLQKNDAKNCFKRRKKKRGKKKSPLHPSYKERPPIL